MSTQAAHASNAGHGTSLNRVAAMATLHCLTGCAIGEVLGMVIGTALGLSNPATIALAVTLAFIFGYSLTMLPLLRAGLAVAVALPIAFASDSFSIAVMELVDNGVMLAIPGAMDAPLWNPLFWGSLGFALVVAYVIAYPVNRHLIARGQGHAVVHAYHGHEGHDATDTATKGLGSTRRLILIGIAAMTFTIGVATAGAVLIGSHTGTSDDKGGEHPGMSGGGDANTTVPSANGGIRTAPLRLDMQGTHDARVTPPSSDSRPIDGRSVE